MAKTPSSMLALGTIAPDFELLNPITNQTQSFQSLKGEKGTVIIFSCNHCPFVLHIEDQLIAIANRYQAQSIHFIAINANDIESYPEDSPENMIAHAQEKQYPFPYLFDATQETAKAYEAACTPDFFLFDAADSLVYRGQMDHSRPGNDHPVDGKDLCHALDCLLENRTMPSEQMPSLGCNIKWKTP